MNSEQNEKMATATGFIAALDQSGGSTPKALNLYGLDESNWSNDEEMFNLVHDMRSRIVTSSAFGGDRILGAILFVNTMNGEVEGRPTAEYLWEVKGVVPILKVDSGLADQADSVQLMKPMPGLDELLAQAKSKGIFGTKMRSVIKANNASGIKAIVDQQFEIGQRILDAGLVPIIEPEVDITCADKASIEAVLQQELMTHLDQIPDGQQVILKLTLPEQDDLYLPCVEHPKTLRVVALSGGYSRQESNQRLSKQHGMVASFSRALTEGLGAQQSQEEFDNILSDTIQSIVDASST
ncbi:MAG: fructose bisphosphate aldolase [Pseudomonadales bacterium]|nr:fructose bisphosphate aldolase [Pseudomonadales bacterium]